MQPNDPFETAPIETIASPPPKTTTSLVRLVQSPIVALLAIFSVLIAVVLLAAFSGYAAGVAERQNVSATAQAAELGAQFALAQQDYQDGLYSRAIQRLTFVLERNPNYPGAAALLAEAREQLGSENVPVPTLSLPTATPAPIGERPTLSTLLAAIADAQTTQDWDRMLNLTVTLRAEYPDHEPATAIGYLYTALRNSGVRKILESPQQLELGLFYLNEAAKIGVLDGEAEQTALWAQIYINGMAVWGVNWGRSAEAFDILNLIAPYFHDTQSRRYQAHLGFADFLAAGGAPCDAVIEYDLVLALGPTEQIEAQRFAAEDACLNPTATPDPDEIENGETEDGDTPPNPDGDELPVPIATLEPSP